MSKFDDFYSKKSASELLNKLRAAKVTPGTMDKAWYDALIIHLQNRQLSSEEKNLFDHILSTDAETLKEEKQSAITRENNNRASPSLSGGEGGRYTALKTVSGLISILGYLVIIVGIVLLFFMLSQDQILMGFVALIASVVIALPLLAYSNLIQVFIDIEHNTRKTNEAMSNVSK